MRLMRGKSAAGSEFPVTGVTGLGFVAIALAVSWAAAACAQSGVAVPAGSSVSTVVLDRVVAVINDDVILESDVQQEMRFADLQGGRLESGASAEQDALERLVDRDLIMRQIKATRSNVALPTTEEIKQQVDTLRGQIPQCAEQHCETDAGWRAFLAARGLTEKDVDDYWSERILILAFIQSRFGAGIRISQAEIEDYYQHNLVPEFVRRKLPPPPLADVSSRIQEILLQQRINTFLQEWLQSLKQEGSVNILGDEASPGGSTPVPSSEPGGRP